MMTPFRDDILALDVKSGVLSEFGKLPNAMASHTSALIGEYILVYGGTNGLKMFDAVIRYHIPSKEWRLMTKYPDSQKGSSFFRDGRLSSVSCVTPGDDGVWILFGGCSATEDHADFLVLPKAHLLDDANFSTITEIM